MYICSIHRANRDNSPWLLVMPNQFTIHQGPREHWPSCANVGAKCIEPSCCHAVNWCKKTTQQHGCVTCWPNHHEHGMCAFMKCCKHIVLNKTFPACIRAKIYIYLNKYLCISKHVYHLKPYLLKPAAAGDIQQKLVATLLITYVN